MTTMSTEQLKLFSDLGSLIQYLIDIDGLNKTKFSEKIGADKSQVTKWTTGKLIPGRDSLKKIEIAYGIKIAKTRDKWTFVDPTLGFKALIPNISAIGQPSAITEINNSDLNITAEPITKYNSETRATLSSERIKKARERAGISHEELSEKLGVHRTTIGKWELNKALPSIENFEKMSEILNVSPIWLMSLDHYSNNIPSDQVLSRKNITDLRSRLAQIQAQANLTEQDFDILHAAIGILGRLLKNFDS